MRMPWLKETHARLCVTRGGDVDDGSGDEG